MTRFTDDDKKLLNELKLAFPEGRMEMPNMDYREGNINGVHMEVCLRSDGTYNVLLSKNGAWETGEGSSLQAAFNQAVRAMESRANHVLELIRASQTAWNLAIMVSKETEKRFAIKTREDATVKI